MSDLSSIERRASRIKLLLMDCDGVLTDGRIWLMEDGSEQKSFNTHDGLGLALCTAQDCDRELSRVALHQDWTGVPANWR